MPDHVDRQPAPRGTPADGEERGAGRAAAPALSRVATSLSAAPAVAQLAALGTRLSARPAAVPVVQRSVLSKYNDKGVLVYYSDLETGRRGKGMTTYATYEEAKAADDKLAKDPDAIERGLKAGRARKNDRRVPTPHGYAKTNATAKPSATRQGPHSVSFASVEQRLQNRLEKGQQDELVHQFPTPEEAEAGMIEEHGLEKGKKPLTRYLTDYGNLRTEFDDRLENDDDTGVNSPLHLVSRKLLNMHPYAAYPGGRSVRQQEDRHERFGSSVIDTTFGMSDEKKQEEFYQTREDLYHSSDDEETGKDKKSKSKRYKYTKVQERPKRFTRDAREKARLAAASGGGAPPVSDPDASTTTTTGGSTPTVGGKRKRSNSTGSNDDAGVTTLPHTAPVSAPTGDKTQAPPRKRLRGTDGAPVDTTKADVVEDADLDTLLDDERMEQDSNEKD